MGANDPAHYQRHDYLEDLVYLEDMFHTLGYEDGLRDGVKAGRLDGREFGAQKAFDLGQELGYYMGSARVWLSSLEQLPDLSKNPPRTIKHLQDLMILI
ncbi:enolase-phosphatase E1, partial [Dimargaris verticillata]